MTGNGPALPFQVDWSAVKSAIRRLRDRAMPDAAERERLADALEEIDRRLKKDPIGMGEPKFELRHLQILVCVGFYRRYQVTFGVQRHHRQIFIRSFEDLKA
jgi:hypothetical protein